MKIELHNERTARLRRGSSLKRILKRFGVQVHNYSIGTTSGIVDLRFITHRLSNGSMVCACFNFVWRLHPWRLIIEFIVRVLPPTRSGLSSDIRWNKSRGSPWRPRVAAFEFIHYHFFFPFNHAWTKRVPPLSTKNVIINLHRSNDNIQLAEKKWLRK